MTSFQQNWPGYTRKKLATHFRDNWQHFCFKTSPNITKLVPRDATNYFVANICGKFAVNFQKFSTCHWLCHHCSVTSSVEMVSSEEKFGAITRLMVVFQLWLIRPARRRNLNRRNPALFVPARESIGWRRSGLG